MKRVFADTYYFLALFNEHDQGHQTALRFSTSHRLDVTTTIWVLTEVLDALGGPATRGHAVRLVQSVRDDPHTSIIPPTLEWFESGLRLYSTRLDKAWSLTDCISFEVMRAMGLTEALTGDRDFEQAGFVRLLP